VGINPYFDLKGEQWNVRLGLKDYFSINGKDKSTHLMPDVTAQVNLTKTVNLYAGVTGEYDVNSMQKITDENPYIDPTIRVDDSYAPFKVFGGLKFSPTSGLLVDGSVAYTSYDKQYFFTNQYYGYPGPMIAIYPGPAPFYLSPKFTELYDKAKVVTAKLNIGYNWKDKIFAHLNARYNSWDTKTQTKAWMKPSTEIEVGGEAKVTRNILVNANYYFAGGKYAYLFVAEPIKMKNTNDLSLGASYFYSDWLTTFVRLNNVFSTKYQTWYGYNSLGLNWQIGAAISF
jgi:opacity protein-like surface antigen